MPKKIRQFSREQNVRLDDLLEVDSLVMAFADDVLDSMASRDLDHDGFAEERVPLYASANNVEVFLPDKERTRRRKAERNARWVINVSF